ncbi:hypothetical protein OESDEN_23856 [Oesophagostomum dentatum]|uniref:Uncharacterized protein n=1 Tax=Oesophagostomum dentatum TaxID=61180 RepID=A0A0B1RV21_OESDE|nr:hypothetical protein OESDEN_23856 [Oesophagostomum dentatum]
MQTSTPVSVVGKPSRQRLRDLEVMVSGISVISPEEETDGTTKEGIVELKII